MDWIGWVHFAAALAALGSGLVVALLPKGRTLHRRVGWFYASTMLTLNVTALMIYDLFGRFGPFHIAALVSLFTLVGGLVPAIRRRPRGRWVGFHAMFMAWSYVGLAAAAASEVTTRYLNVPFWWLVLAATLLVVAVGGTIVTRRVPPAIARFEPARARAGQA